MTAFRQVHPVQVHVIGAHPPQAGLQRPDRDAPAIPGGADAGAWRDTAGVLRGEDEVVAAPGQELAGQFLGAAALVGIGGIQERASGLGEGLEDSAGLGRLGPGAGPGAEDRRAQGKFRYPQAGQAAERLVAEHAGRPRGGICGHGWQVLSSAGSGRRPGSG